MPLNRICKIISATIIVWLFTQGTIYAEFNLINTLQLISLEPRSNLTLSSMDNEFETSLSTYLGGSNWDRGGRIHDCPDGSVVIAGFTSSTNFPLMNPFQNSSSGADEGFVTKITPDGSSQIFSTYVGGSDNDIVSGLGVDSVGNIVIVGATWSSNFPTFNALQSQFGGGLNDAFVTKFTSNGTIVFSTFIGGSGSDWAYGVAFDAEDNILFTGHMSSTDYPTINAIQNQSAGMEDAVITKLSSDGQEILLSTYLGGERDDLGANINFDSDGNLLIVGNTESDDFPLEAAFQDDNGGSADLFITKLTPDCQNILFSTYFGGSRRDMATSVVGDSHGNLIVTGMAVSDNITTLNAAQENHQGGFDAIVIKFNMDGSLNFSTYLGGSHDEWSLHVTLDVYDRPVVAGYTQSTDSIFTLLSNQSLGGTKDGFLLGFDHHGQIEFVKLIGGNNTDEVRDFMIFPDGSIALTGGTYSDNFATPDVFQTTRKGSMDAFVCFLHPLDPGTTSDTGSTSTSINGTLLDPLFLTLTALSFGTVAIVAVVIWRRK